MAMLMVGVEGVEGRRVCGVGGVCFVLVLEVVGGAVGAGFGVGGVGSVGVGVGGHRRGGDGVGGVGVGGGGGGVGVVGVGVGGIDVGSLGAGVGGCDFWRWWCCWCWYWCWRALQGAYINHHILPGIPGTNRTTGILNMLAVQNNT